MIITKTEFLYRTRLDQETLQVWIREEWIAPQQGAEAEPVFSEADLARAGLIRDLQEDMGVNAEGVGVILNLVDQLHSLRWALASRIGAAAPDDMNADSE
jgi:chaperone modulatory protein CbpM